MCTFLNRFFILAIGALAAHAAIGANLTQLTSSTTFIHHAQFLVDKETADLAAIVKVKHSEIRWVILPDGDHISLLVADVEMERVLSGSHTWPVGATQTVVQYDYSDLIFEPISPPAIEGQRYLLFAFATPKDGKVPSLASWTAHPQGFLLVRGEKDREFVFWNGRSYTVTAIQKTLVDSPRLPLDKIFDPVRRLQVAEARMKDGKLGDEKAFIHGLLMNVLDPIGQAKDVERPPNSGTSTDVFGMNRGEGQPHGLWYNSLVLLRDLGKDKAKRENVVAALTPMARTGRSAIRLAASLALVDLESDGGRDALIKGFESESGAISSDPPDTITYPGRFPYDESSITACSNALARLGDRRGLKHAKPEVRLAAAAALVDKPDAELRAVLKKLADELEPKVEKLRTSGELAKPRRPGDYTNRYPADWVSTLQFLARAGDDQGFRRLVEAFIVDANTYPKEDAALMPTGRIASWSNGPSPARGIRGANDNSSQVRERLQKLFAQDERWDQPSLRMLRASLEETRPGESKEPTRPKPTEAEITKILGNEDPNKRAEGLAAAGFHQMDMFYPKVLDAALNGKGIEKNAALYALGFYGRDIPEATLRKLMAAEDIELRTSAVELATRKNPTRFAQETMNFVRAQIAHIQKKKADDWQAQRGFAYLPRILCRLARGPIPRPLLDGLKDKDPVVRRTVVQALELSGNPYAIRSIEPLITDSDVATRKASQQALRILGPA